DIEPLPADGVVPRAADRVESGAERCAYEVCDFPENVTDTAGDAEDELADTLHCVPHSLEPGLEPFLHPVDRGTKEVPHSLEPGLDLVPVLHDRQNREPYGAGEDRQQQWPILLRPFPDELDRRPHRVERAGDNVPERLTVLPQ